jgi:crotonobetainyl-CoA:carnitine CoA-transferase CaiB-like acyl-CoA transferase
LSGLMAVTGEPDGPPMKVGVALLDLLAGLEAAVGALAALLARERTAASSAPRRVEVSLVEAGVTSLINVLANLVASGVEPRRWGNAHPNIAPYQVFATADGHVAVAVGNDAQFRRLLAVLGLAAESSFATNPGRIAALDDLQALLTPAIARRGRDELIAELDAADVPAAPVNSVSQALAEMDVAHDGAWLQEKEGVRLAPDPIRLDGERLGVRLPPPRLGEHTDAVLGEAGLSPREIAELRAAGVVA